MALLYHCHSEWLWVELCQGPNCTFIEAAAACGTLLAPHWIPVNKATFMSVAKKRLPPHEKNGSVLSCTHLQILDLNVSYFFKSIQICAFCVRWIATLMENPATIKKGKKMYLLTLEVNGPFPQTVWKSIQFVLCNNGAKLAFQNTRRPQMEN